MRRAIRAALLISVLLFAVSLATCHFGVRHEINKIPPDVLARIGDTDWMGFEWIMRAVMIQAIAFALAVAAAVAWVVDCKRTGANSVPR